MASSSAEVQAVSDFAFGLRDAAEREDRARIADVLERAIDIPGTAGVAELIRYRARVRRLMEMLDETPDSSARSYALGRLEEADRLLDRQRTRALGARAQQDRERRAETVRGEVLALILEAPRRPRDLARELSIDPSQVSRALRELRSSGEIERGQASTDDRRAHLYLRRGAAHQPAGTH
jgi:predicted Rossmann fold nucleotide-binding protein DprA/Smf involved in DNA uptake